MVRKRRSNSYRGDTAKTDQAPADLCQGELAHINNYAGTQRHAQAAGSEFLEFIEMSSNIACSASRVQGNESRLTSQRPENLQQVLRLPRGALAASLDGALIGDLADHIEGEVADRGHVGGTVAGAQS
jgi:hypothetical protein